jgi:protein subunit release factor A
MADSGQEIRVSFTKAAGGAAFFLVDVCAMLRAIAGRSGDSLDTFQARSNSAAGDEEERAALHSPAWAMLRHEVGLHRAQFVPQDSPTSRVETTFLRVEILGATEDGSGMSSAEVVRTYNYPLRKCTHHQSGLTASLDDVLAGRAG